jgi:hypothetical protein
MQQDRRQCLGVETGALKEAKIESIFRAWVEDWEEDARKKMTVLPRHSYSLNIKVLFSVIPAQRSRFQFGSKIWSSAGGDEIDGSWLVFV